MTRRDVLIVVAAIVGSSMVMLGESVVNLALPHIGQTFGVPFSALQWVVDGYNLTLSAFILFGGSLGDMFGLRRVYIWSTVVLVFLSVLCAFAWSAGALIALRALLGVAGALLTPVSLALLNAQLPQEFRGRAVGYWTAWTSIVLALGPLVGGYFVDVFSWRAIFLVNLPLGLIALACALPSLEGHTSARRPSIDWTGVALGFLSLAGLTYGLIEGPGRGWDFATAGAIVAGVIFFALFVVWEKRAAHPLVDLGLFRNATFSATNAATFFLYAGFAGFGFVFSVFLQTKGGYSALQAGAAFLPSSIVLALFSGRVGAYATKWGPRLFMTVGPLLCAAGMLMLLRLVAGISYWTGVLPGVMLFSIGLVLVVAPLTATALNSAPDEKSGIASAINNGVATVGPLLIIALLGLLGAEHIYSFSVLLCAVLAALAGAISFMFVRRISSSSAV
jgi:EmrB/QacA subfamily drug resistance transporter